MIACTTCSSLSSRRFATASCESRGALSSYIHGIARRSLWTDISLRKRRERLSDSLRQWVVSNQHSPNPEEVLSVREQDQTIVDLLGTLSLREREILTRFYLYERPKEKICQDLDLTENTGPGS